MRVSVIHDEREFFELEARWDNLLENSHYSLPFYSWSWYWAWWKHFSSGADDLFIVTGEDDLGRLRLVAPLMKRVTKLRGFRVSEIRFMANGIGPRNSILFARSESAVDAATVLVKCLAEHGQEWDLVTLSNIEESMPYVRPMRELAENHNLSIIEEPGLQSPYIRLEDDFEHYLSRNFARKHRYNIRRAAKTLALKPGYRVVQVSHRDEMPVALEQAFRVSKSSWKGAQDTDMAGSEARKGFYIDVTRRLAEAGLVRIWLLELGGEPVAVQYQLKSMDTIHLLVNDYDEEHRDLSPGTSLLYRVVEELHKEQVKEFDFTGDAYEYKMGWATGLRRHVSIQLFSRKCYSRLIFLTKSHALPLVRRIRDRARRFIPGLIRIT